MSAQKRTHDNTPTTTIIDYITKNIMEVNEEILNAIAEELNLGMKCFLDKETFEIISFPDKIKYGYFDEEDWKEEMHKVKNDPSKFMEIESRNSTEVFRAMEWFIQDVKDESARQKLTQAIANKKPFTNFERQLQQFPGLLEKWFAFNKECAIDFIKEQVR